MERDTWAKPFLKLPVFKLWARGYIPVIHIRHLHRPDDTMCVRGEVLYFFNLNDDCYFQPSRKEIKQRPRVWREKSRFLFMPCSAGHTPDFIVKAHVVVFSPSLNTSHQGGLYEHQCGVRALRF